jgi:hypothetical protein
MLLNVTSAAVRCHSKALRSLCVSVVAAKGIARFSTTTWIGYATLADVWNAAQSYIVVIGKAITWQTMSPQNPIVPAV